MTELGVSVLYLWRINPEIFAARRRIHPGTKRWDRILLGLLFPAMLAIPPVAALDDGRFHWSRMSGWFVGLGYLLLTTAVAITARAQAVNRFSSRACASTPNVGIMLWTPVLTPSFATPAISPRAFCFQASLWLGSWWALVPAGFAVLLIAIRTAWEDRTLHAEFRIRSLHKNGYAFD